MEADYTFLTPEQALAAANGNKVEALARMFHTYFQDADDPWDKSLYRRMYMKEAAVAIRFLPELERLISENSTAENDHHIEL